MTKKDIAHQDETREGAIDEIVAAMDEEVPHRLTAQGFFEAQERSNAARRELGLD